MQIKSNGLVKILVPAMLVVGVLIGIKSCKDTEPAGSADLQGSVLNELSPEELRALGIKGDTLEDTLRTLIGRYRTTQNEQEEIKKRVDSVIKENEQLRSRSQNVSGHVNDAVAALKQETEIRQQQLQQEQLSLKANIQQLVEQLGSMNQHSQSDIPPGLGLDDIGRGSLPAGSNDGLLWISPQDQKEVNPRDIASGNAVPQFPTSFLDDNPITRQKAAYELQVKGYTSEKSSEAQAEPVYTLPENSTLTGSRAMTALLGRVPINGSVTDPYPFKILIGRDNLTANGIELPEAEGAIVSGTASGDWTLSCVRGQVNSITFVFTDGRVRTLPEPNKSGSSNQNAGGAAGGIGWISDDNGIPCISGVRKTNAATYLPTLFALSSAGTAGEALSQGQYSTQNNINGLSSTLTGSAGQAALGKAISGGMSETVDWVKQRYGMTFDAIYVPPGQRVAVHITRQLAIDYEDQGRKVRYEFSLPGESASKIELD